MNIIDLSNTSNRVIPRMLEIQANEVPDLPFLINENSTLSFRETQDCAASLAAGLKSLGLKRSDRVVIFLSNRVEMVVAVLAINMLGAVWVPVSTDYKGEWLKDAVKRSRPGILITEKIFQDTLQPVLEEESELTTVIVDQKSSSDVNAVSYHELLTHAPIEVDYSDLDYGDTSAIVWTSGTTGKSKGVMVSHNGWMRPIVLGSSVSYASQPGDVIFNVLPLFHAASWNTSIFRALAEGLPVVIETGFSVTNFWQRIKQFGATQTFTLGAMHMFLWHAPSQENDAENTLRVMQAIPLPADIQGDFENRFGVKTLGGGLGQSECMLITTEAGYQGKLPPNSIGIPKEDTEVSLFNDDDEQVAQGEVGEIRIRPLEPYIVCNGYFDDPVATESAWKNGWFCTGDMGRKNEDGVYFFVDRKKDAVRFAGRNISTLEVEGVMRRHPAVADVAAYGIPAKELVGEDELKIDIILGDDADMTYEDFAEYINQNAPYYFVPRYMNFVEKFPYTPTNKLKKYELRDKGVTETTWDRNTSGFKLVK